MKRKSALGIVFIIVIILISMNLFSRQKDEVLKVGDQVPSFSLLDQDGKMFDIKDFVGKENLVIYFYPKDDTPGCTKQACSFRDSFSQFETLNATVIGISSDSVESHREFADKYQLQFSLLSDTEGKVRALFGVKNDVLGLIPGRVSYIVDKNGVIISIYNNQFGSVKHIENALEVLRLKA